MELCYPEKFSQKIPGTAETAVQKCTALTHRYFIKPSTHRRLVEDLNLKIFTLGFHAITPNVILPRRAGTWDSYGFTLDPRAKVSVMSAKRTVDERDKTDKKKKKKKSCDVEAELCSGVEDEQVKRAVKEAWRRGSPCSQGDLELDCHPFPHCIIKNFLSSKTFVESLQSELLALNFHEKSNDLYKFKQSDDLRKREEPHIAGLRAALFGHFRSWLGEVLGVELEPTVDISCAKYEYTDVLLCHDDELEGRRIAFILYLVPPWQSSDGGTLDLYTTDSNFQPQSIVKSLVPSWNTLVLFEVSPVSFHQVSEVLSQDKCRLSLSGWFHGPSVERPTRYREPPVPRNPHLPRDETVLLEWVNPVYLDISQQEKIQEEFEDSSEIQLKDFLREEKFAEVKEALRLPQIQWMKNGPPNKRCYEVASLDSLPECVSGCWELLHSEAFFLLLSNFTGLRLHYLCPADDDDDDDDDEEEEDDQDEKKKMKKTEGEAATSSRESSSAHACREKELSTPVCCGEVRRWSHGSYTLLHDGEAARAEYALDLVLPFSCTDWQSEFGGFTSYVANEEDEELLTVYPEDNSLALVYRDKETLKFVKHINHKSSPVGSSTCREFYDFSFVYYE
ncbi:prolyl 3-hydroxylase OGFOD1 [Xenentodon cancila]